MDFKKTKSMKISELIEIRKEEYITLQLIPVKSNRNYNTDAIASMINKLYVRADKLVKIENKKMILNSYSKVSYYIHITKKEVQFYFILPKIHLMKFKTKFSELWKNIEVKEVEALPIDFSECTKYQLQYTHNETLSLNVNKSSNDLLNANMSVLDILEDEECIGIYYNFIPTGTRENLFFRKKYKDNIKKYKDGYNLKKTKTIADIAIGALKALLQYTDDFITSLQKEKRERNELFITMQKNPSESTKRKAHSEICKTQIVVMAKSEDKKREKELSISMCNSFKSISDDNELTYKEVKGNIDLNRPIINGIEVNRTTIEECQNFISLPGRELIEQYKVIDHIETKENPVPEELKEGVIDLGIVKYKDNKDHAHISNEESLQSLPLAIMGGSRSGKSTFTINMCKNIIDAGEGLIVIDFIKNTELAEKVKRITPVDRLIEIDLSNPKHIQALAYNEQEVKTGMSDDDIIKIARMKTNYILQLVNTVNTDDKQLAPKMRKYLGAAARIAFCFNGTSIKDILKILQFHQVRYDFINRLSDSLKAQLEDSIIALQELDEWSKETKDKPSEICGTKDNKIESIIDRIDILRENLIIDSMLSKDPTNNINFVEAMEQGKIVIIRMRDIDFDDDTSIDILTSFFIQKIWIALKIRGTMHDLPRRCTVVIDEVFQTPTAQKLLSKYFVQSAKFGLKFVLTLHYMDQLSKEAQSALKNSNASYMLISGVDKKAFIALQEEFEAHGYTLDDLLNLKQYDSLNLIKSKDGYKAFITHLPPKLKVGAENKIQKVA